MTIAKKKKKSKLMKGINSSLNPEMDFGLPVE